MSRKLFVIAFLGLIALPAKANAWGGVGHRMVCGIAWQRMSPEAKALAGKLLGTADEKTFVDGCVWADEIRREMPETYNYHFINIPHGAVAVDRNRDCGDPAKRCAPWAIMEYARVLQDPKATEEAKRNAIRFIAHFIGDLHQPLHAGRPDDLGANRIYVDFFGDAGNAERQNNLHSVWDSQILRRANETWPETSNVLASEIPAADAAKWEMFDPWGWAQESYLVCEEYVYGKLPVDRKIGNEYFMPAVGYSNVRIQQAGVRIAYVLNAIASGRALSAS
jgi:hypothetical protein